jgi:hypothetical protein
MQNVQKRALKQCMPLVIWSAIDGMPIKHQIQSAVIVSVVHTEQDRARFVGNHAVRILR